MAKDVTMRDIAKTLDISTVSVSKALTDKDGVSNEMRMLIKKTAEKMGYRYSATKSGKEGRTFNIGVLVEEHFVEIIASSFYFKMYQSIVMQLAKSKYSAIMEVLTADMLHTIELPRIVTEQKVDGLIALGKIESHYLQKLRETDLPIVYLDYYDRHMEVPSVITDNVYGTYMLTNYVASQGHKKIAFVGNIDSTPSILDRYLGYIRGLLVNKIPFKNEYLICDRGEDGKYIDMQMPEDMPTAFVCNCDDIAYVLMEQVKKLGYRIPEDISVVGFDNNTFADYSTPKLTTVEVPVDIMTETACELLIRMIQGEKDIRGRKVISGEMMVRESVARIEE